MVLDDFREKFHKIDGDFSSKFHNKNPVTGEKKVSWSKVILTWFLVLLILNILLNVFIISTMETDGNSIFDYLGQNNNNDLFLKDVDVGGITFHIPDGYSLKSSSNGSYMSTDLYMKDSSSISFIVNSNPLFSLDQLKESQEQGGYTTKSATIGGYSGFESISNSSSIKTFYFEKDGAIVGVLLSSDFDFEKDMEKIIK